MPVKRTEGRRTNQRAFRPTMDNQLESRFLLTSSNRTAVVYPPATHNSFFLKHPKIGLAFKYQQPPFTSSHAKHFTPTHPIPGAVGIQTAHGGQSVRISTSNGVFNVALTAFFPTTPQGALTTGTTGQEPIQNQIPGAAGTQPIGTVRAYPMTGGRVGLILDGTTTASELDISPVGFPQKKSYAHSFAYAQAGESHILNIGQITVNSGQVSAIQGYHTADLSGPLLVAGTEPVDRLAFDALLPGSAIVTGGDLNTLEVLKGINMNSGPGIAIGRDLNLINVGLDANFSNGASLRVGRFLGLTPQPAKGTGNGSNFLSLNQSLLGTNSSQVLPGLAGYFQGNLTFNTGSVFSVVDGIANTGITQTSNNSTTVITSTELILVNGIVAGDAPVASQILFPAGNLNINDVVTVGTNFVARNGFSFPDFVFPPPTT